MTNLDSVGVDGFHGRHASCTAAVDRIDGNRAVLVDEGGRDVPIARSDANWIDRMDVCDRCVVVEEVVKQEWKWDFGVFLGDAFLVDDSLDNFGLWVEFGGESMCCRLNLRVLSEYQS